MPPPTEEDVHEALRKMGPARSSLASGVHEEEPRASLALLVRVRTIGDADCAALASLLTAARLSVLTSIDLSHNLVGDSGAAALGRALACGAPALAKLSLHENAIGDAGLTALADALCPGGSPGLTHLRFTFNRVGDAGAAGLARAWRRGGCQQLVELQAGCNRIGSAGLAALVEQLHGVPDLNLLSLGSAMGGNCVDDDGAHLLVKALRMNGLLRSPLTVRLMYNPISPRAAALLREVEQDCGPQVRVSF